MFGCTPLFYASTLEYVKLLIEFGANIDHKSLNGSTALFYHHNDFTGINDEAKRIVEYLIEKGADISILENHTDDFFSKFDQGRKEEKEKYKKTFFDYWDVHKDDVW